MEYKKFVTKLFTAWGLIELLLLIFCTLAYWADTTRDLNVLVGAGTISVAILVGIIFLIGTISMVNEHD
jgi:hypothetical protein